jgi:PIN domain
MAVAKLQRASLVEPGQVPLVYLDANVLIPEYLRSVFLDLSHAGLIRVHWGKQVLVEVRRNLLRPRFGQSAANIDRLLRLMTEAFPDALVPGSDALESSFADTTDPKDAHVAAGALQLSQRVHKEQPVVLVTSNTATEGVCGDDGPSGKARNAAQRPACG